MNQRVAPRGTQAVQRAIRLLKSFSGPGEELSLAQLAERHDLARPTAHRILAALEAEGLVGRNPETAAYRLAPGANLLAPEVTSEVASEGAQKAPVGAVAAASHQGQRAASDFGLSPPHTTPFHGRIVERLSSHAWREWSGYISPESYEPTYTREYYAIRNAAALIDVSPLFKVEVTGPDAQRLVQRMMTRDFSKCRVGQVFYSAWCDDDGKLVQDGNVIRLDEDRFQISAAEPVLGWVEDCGAGMNVSVRDRTRDFGTLSLQGPRSRSVVERVVEDLDLARLRYFRAAYGTFDGGPILVSRTGFTGDLGYELWIDSARAESLWDRLLEDGQAFGLLPVGLVAMDAARIEAGLVLIDIDFVSASHAFLEGRKSSPYEAGLGWTVKLVPGNEFIGRRALEREQESGSQWATVGVEVSWHELERIYGEAGLRPQSVGEAPCREPTALWAPDDAGRPVTSSSRGRQIGQITSQVFSPILKKQIGIASVESGYSKVGSEVEIDVRVDRKRTRVRGRIAALPFYDPPHKRALG